MGVSLASPTDACPIPVALDAADHQDVHDEGDCEVDEKLGDRGVERAGEGATPGRGETDGVGEYDIGSSTSEDDIQAAPTSDNLLMLEREPKSLELESAGPVLDGRRLAGGGGEEDSVC